MQHVQSEVSLTDTPEVLEYQWFLNCSMYIAFGGADP